MPDPHRAPLVLIAPAMAIGSGYYRPLVEAFEQRGWQARALTRRGFERDGQRASRTADWGYADEIADMAQSVAAARAEQPDRPVLLLGHSLGGQLAMGHELTHEPADGVVTVGGAIPYYRRFRFGGAHLVVMAGVIVPGATALFGYLPKPAFGGPGARTLMREWARMVLTGRPPYPVTRRIDTPSLVVSLDGDELSPTAAVDFAVDALFDPTAVTRWNARREDLPAGTSLDHVGWVRTPQPFVDRIVEWWDGCAPSIGG